MVSCSVAGALAGGAEEAGLLLRGSLPLQAVFMLAAGLTLCLIALYFAGVLPMVRALESTGAVLWRQVDPFAKQMVPVDSLPKAMELGLV